MAHTRDYFKTSLKKPGPDPHRTVLKDLNPPGAAIKVHVRLDPYAARVYVDPENPTEAELNQNYVCKLTNLDSESEPRLDRVVGFTRGPKGPFFTPQSW